MDLTIGKNYGICAPGILADFLMYLGKQMISVLL